MAPTNAAAQILPHINIVLDELACINQYGRADDLSGKLKVAMPESFLTYKAQTALKSFRQNAMAVQLTLMTGNCLEIQQEVLNGSIDFGIHYTAGRSNEYLCSNRMGQYALKLVCSPMLKDRDFTALHQKKAVCLLTDDKRSIFFTIFNQYLQENDIMIDDVIELGSIEAIKRSAASNIGVSVLPDFVVAEDLSSGSLEAIDVPLQPIEVVCTYHKNKWLSPAMQYFIKLLGEVV